MSNVLNSDLRTRKPEDFEKMVAYVTKLTSEWSLKELGYDITIPDEERIKKQGFYYQGFEVRENTLTWNDFSGNSQKEIPVGEIIDQTSKHFPEMELLFRSFWEGPLDYECIIKNGVETEIKPYCLGFYIEEKDDFRCLADMVQKEEQQAYATGELYQMKAPYFIDKVIIKEDQCFVLIYFEPLSKEDSESAQNGIMDKVLKLLPQSDFYCFLFENDDMGDRIERKAHVRNGQAEWQDIPKQGDRPVFYQDYDEENPFVEEITSEVVKAFFPEK